MLMSLENAWDSFESINIGILQLGPASDVRHHETGGSFVEHQFARMNNLSELLQKALNSHRIRYKWVYDLGPRFVERLIPDTCGEELNDVFEAFWGISNVFGSFFKQSVPPNCLHQVHFVDETKHSGSRGTFFQCPNNIAIIDNIGCEFSWFDIEDKDQNRNACKDVWALMSKITLYKSVLP